MMLNCESTWPLPKTMQEAEPGISAEAARPGVMEAVQGPHNRKIHGDCVNRWEGSEVRRHEN